MRVFDSISHRPSEDGNPMKSFLVVGCRGSCSHGRGRTSHACGSCRGTRNQPCEGYGKGGDGRSMRVRCWVRSRVPKDGVLKGGRGLKRCMKEGESVLVTHHSSTERHRAALCVRPPSACAYWSAAPGLQEALQAAGGKIVGAWLVRDVFSSSGVPAHEAVLLPPASRKLPS